MKYPQYIQYATLYPKESQASQPPFATFAGGGGGLIVSAGGSSNFVNQLIFAASNDITFGLNGSTITASFQGGGNVSILNSTGNISFANAHGVTFGALNSTITASVSQSQQPMYFSAQGGSSSANTLVFANSNGLTFSNSNGSVIASYTVPNVSDFLYSSDTAYLRATASTDFLGTDYTSHTHSQYLNTSQSSLFRQTSQNSQLQFTSANSNFLGTGATVSFRFTSQNSQLRFTSADSQLRFTSADSELQFTSQMSDYLGTGYTTHTHTQANQAYSAGNGSASFQTIVFADSNGVSFSTGTQGLYATVKTDYQTSGNYLTTQSGQAVSAQGGSSTFQTLVFTNSNGFSFSNTGGSIWGSYTVPTLTNSSLTIGAGGSTLSSVSQLVFSNSNGISFGASTSNNGSITITASHNGLTSQLNQAVSAANGSFAFQTLVFANSNGVSFSTGTQGVFATVQTNYLTSQSNQAFSAGAASSTFQTLSFQDSNGISFSNNGGAIRLTHDLQFTSNTSAITSNALNTSASRVINILAATNNTGGGTASLSSNVSFSNANNFTFYTSAGNAIVGSFSQSVDTGKAGTGFTSAGNNIGLSGTLNTNGLSLSATVAAQTNQTLGLYASSNTTGQSSSSTVDARTLSFRGAGIVSVGLSGGELVISASAAGAADGYNILAAGTQTANTTGSVLFQNSNGITFGMGNSSVITATIRTDYQSSGNYLTTAALSSQTLAFSLGGNSATTNSSQILNGGYVLAGGNGVTIQQSNNTVSLSVATNYQSQGAYLTTAAQSSQTLVFSLGGNSATTNSSQISNGGFVLAGGNGVTIQQSNNTVSLSVATNYQSQGAYLTTAAQSSQTLAFSLSGNTATTNSSQILNGGYALAGGNGVTLQQSNNTVSISVATNYQSQGAYLTTAAQSTQTLAFTLAGNVATTNSSQIANGGFSLAGGNGVTIQQSNATLSLSVATSYAASNHSHGNPTLALTNLTGTTASASNGFTLSLSAAAPGGGGGAAISAGGNSQNTGTVNFANSNGITFGLSNNGTLTASHNGITSQTNQTMSWYAIGNTTQNSNTQLDARTISLNGLGAMTVGYSNGSVQLSAPATSSLSGTGQVSISVNGSTISIGVPNAGTKSGYSPYGDVPAVIGQVGQGSLIFDPEYLPNIQFDRVVWLVNNTNQTNSSGSHTLSFWFGVYTRNVSTLSLVTSQSTTYALTHSGTAGSYASYSGLRNMTMGLTATLTEAQYWLAYLSRTTSGGANGSYSNLQISNINTNFVGNWNSATNSTNQRTLGNGFYSATTSGMPASVGFNQIYGTGSDQFRFPIIMLASSTV